MATLGIDYGVASWEKRAAWWPVWTLSLTNMSLAHQREYRGEDGEGEHIRHGRASVFLRGRQRATSTHRVQLCLRQVVPLVRFATSSTKTPTERCSFMTLPTDPALRAWGTGSRKSGAIFTTQEKWRVLCSSSALTRYVWPRVYNKVIRILATDDYLPFVKAGL